MTKRIEVTLDRLEPSIVRIAPQIIENIEAADLSVDQWSEAAVEQMFEAANIALKELDSEP